MTRILQGLILGALFLVPAGIVAALLEVEGQVIQGFCWGTVLCGVWCSWLLPRVGTPG